MKEVLVSEKTAHLAKLKGFNEACQNVYREDGNLYKLAYFEGGGEDDIEDGYTTNDFDPLAYVTNNFIYVVPTQSFLQAWLREKHSITIIIANWQDLKPKKLRSYVNYEDDLPDDDDTYNYYIHHNKKATGVKVDFETYEKALEAALYDALIIIEI